MMTHNGQSPAEHPGRRRLLSLAGIAAAVVGVVGHLAGGGVLMHVALPAALVHFGVNVANLGAGVLAIGLAAGVLIKLLVVFGARRWWRSR